MTRIVTAFAFTLLLAGAAAAQQTRAKLDAPGKVPFGTSYEQGQVLLGSTAKPTSGHIDKMKSLFCRDCLPLKGVGLIVMFFLDDGGLASIEAKYFRRGSKYSSLETCEKDETQVLPTLIAQYGEPDSKELEDLNGYRRRWVSFKFADGSLIEYTASFLDGMPGLQLPGMASPGVPPSCMVQVEYLSKAGAGIP